MRNLTLACLLLVPLAACAQLPIGVARPDRAQGEGEEHAIAAAKAAMQRGGGDPLSVAMIRSSVGGVRNQVPNGTWHVSAMHVWLVDHNAPQPRHGWQALYVHRQRGLQDRVLDAK